MILGEQESNGEHAWFGGEDVPRRDSSASPGPQDPNASTEDEESSSNEDGNTPNESTAENRLASI